MSVTMNNEILSELRRSGMLNSRNFLYRFNLFDIKRPEGPSDISRGRKPAGIKVEHPPALKGRKKTSRTNCVNVPFQLAMEIIAQIFYEITFAKICVPGLKGWHLKTVGVSPPG